MSDEVKPESRVHKVGGKRRGTVDSVEDGIAIVYWDNETRSRVSIKDLVVIPYTPKKKK